MPYKNPIGREPEPKGSLKCERKGGRTMGLINKVQPFGDNERLRTLNPKTSMWQHYETRPYKQVNFPMHVGCPAVLR